MDTTIDNIQLKRAWQTAFELRLCPDGRTLFADTPDENLQKHLEICHVCREKWEMPVAQREAWEELVRRFAGAGQKPARPERPVAGQVWSLKRSLSGWGKDGYFYNSPMVLLLERVEGSQGFKSVQLYRDRLLMGEGDVWLDDRFGFAQGWNCYSLHEEALDGCWGAVADKVLEQLQAVVAMKHSPVEEDSILYFFRRMEINVGAKVALPSMAVLVEEWEATVAGEVLHRQEIIKGFFVTVKKAGEVVLTIVYEALANIKEAVICAPPEALALARSREIQTGNAPKTEFPKVVDLMEKQQIQFVPIDIYSADDNTCISVKKISHTTNQPDLVVFYNSSIIDSSKVVFQSWETDEATIVIRDFWKSRSELKQAVLEISFKESKTIINIHADKQQGTKE